MKLKRSGIVIMIILALAIGVSAVAAQPGDGGRGKQGDRRTDAGMKLRGAIELVQIVADETGLTRQEIRQQLRAGATLAEIITAKDGSVDEVMALAIEQGTDLLNQAVTNGRLTQTEADERLENLPARIDEALNASPVQRQMEREIVRRVAGETGLPLREVMKQWRDGETLSEILITNNEDVLTFMDDTLARVEARLDQAVTNGRLTQEQADQRLENLKTLLPDFLNQPFPENAIRPTTTGI
ncbi:MAG: hypothetical protein H7X77_10995 [Anaerolineae bacterium]|nr:hypothetical protein [Anaerolineae bacterium]